MGTMDDINENLGFLLWTYAALLVALGLFFGWMIFA